MPEQAQCAKDGFFEGMNGFAPVSSLQVHRSGGIISTCLQKWRADREAEGARLLSEYTPQGYLGFESPLLRQLFIYAVLTNGVFLLSRPDTARAPGTPSYPLCMARRVPKDAWPL